MLDTKLKVAIDYKRCNPHNCERGVCVVVGVCPTKLWKQLGAYDSPYPVPGFCQECGKCVESCPLEAIRML
ncbi:MAG: 4Fe-4S binding protein [Thermodesulfobacteriota bacterium]